MKLLHQHINKLQANVHNDETQMPVTGAVESHEGVLERDTKTRGPADG